MNCTYFNTFNYLRKQSMQISLKLTFIFLVSGIFYIFLCRHLTKYSILSSIQSLFPPLIQPLIYFIAFYPGKWML